MLPNTPVGSQRLPMGLRPIVAFETAVARQEWCAVAIPGGTYHDPGAGFNNGCW